MRISTQLNCIKSQHNPNWTIQYTLFIVLSFLSLEAHTATAELVFTNVDGHTSSIFIADDCDNVTNGGTIQGDEVGCDDPFFDPSIISNLVMPLGGTGELQFIWVSTTDKPDEDFVVWSPISGSTSAFYDPGPINETTYFMRCARRDGCIDYIGESNIVEKKVQCCDNITNGGIVVDDQEGCAPSYDPELLSNLISPSGGTGEVEYVWFQSTVGPPFLPDSPNWTAVPNSNSPEYDPAPISQTTYFIRCARREECTTYTGESNIIIITIHPNPNLPILIVTPPSCQGLNNGSISVVENGNLPYTYNWNTGASSSSIENLSTGIYQLTITDNNGCFSQTEGNLSEPASLVVNIETTDIVCNGNDEGIATATIDGGTMPYSYRWNDANNQTTATAINLEAGDYILTVTDANGCTTIAETTIENQGNLGINIMTNSLQCVDDSNGTATVGGIGGTPPYSYLWSTNETTPTITNLSAMTYGITVTDQNNCSTTTTVTIDAPDELVINVQTTSVSCFGTTDGLAEANVSGGTAPYTYQWNDGANQTTEIATNLAAGNYTLTVTDANDCTKTTNITINEGNGLNIFFNKIDANCANGSLGMAIANVANGTAPYTYQWNDAANQTTETVNDLDVGTYTVTVMDANGCTESNTVTIGLIGQLTLNFTKTDATCFDTNDGSASVMINGGAAPFQYEWSNNATTNSINDLSAGLYQLTVTDANNCTRMASLIIESPTAISTTISTTDANCDGATGTASVQVTGGNSPYTYRWNDDAAQTTATATNLNTGNYTVMVTDANNCTNETSVFVNANFNLDISIQTTHPTCADNDTGSATATVNMGTPPFTYQWNDANMQTTATATQLSPGDYTLQIIDANGCTMTESVTINNGTNINLSTDSANPTCANGQDGAAIVTVSGGQMPYTYLWNDASMQNTATAIGLVAGNYTVTVTDANGCSETASVNIASNTGFDISFMTTNISCSDSSDGMITVTATGGLPPYTYLWENGATTATISNLHGGNYNITVTDSNSCITEGTATVNKPQPLQLTLSGTNINCINGTMGTATATVMGGETPYTYLWNDANAQTTMMATNLETGTYNVLVTEANGCTVMSSISIQTVGNFEVMMTPTSISCPDANDGTATANPSGGTAPYTYLWNNGSTSSMIANLSVGTYDVTVTDVNGCTAENNVTINEPDPLQVSIAPTNGDCSNGNMGEATATPSGGTAPYSYFWNLPTPQTTATATGLSTGTYTVIITDNNDCMIAGTVTIQMVNSLTINTTGTNVSCINENDGTAQSMISGGTPPFTYAWNNNASASNLTNLNTGLYTVTITDNNGCSGTSSVTIGSPAAIQINIDVINASCNGLGGRATVNVSGGTAPYSYQWDDPNAQNTATATNLSPGDYAVIITDANGCKNVRTATIELSGSLNINIVASSMSVCSGGSILLSTNPTGGQYTYSWSATGGNFNNSNSSSPTYSMMNSGTYTISVQVSDAQGCQGTTSIQITVNPQLSPSISPNNTGVCSGTPVNLSVFPTGSNYTYNWTATGGNFNNSNSSNPTYTMMTPGTYTISVTVNSNEGCSATANTTITIQENPACSAGIVSPVSLRNGADGSASVNIFSGTTPYNFNWNNGDMTQTITGLGADTYTVTVTDALGCTCSSSITLNNPAKLGNFVWHDLDRDGIQDANEAGIPNVSVTLSGTDIFNNAVSITLTTDENGMYMFDGLEAGTYKVTFDTPQDYSPTLSNVGNNEAIDNDADPNTGMTANVTLNYGDYHQDLDAGFYSNTVNIGDYIWHDFNRNGIQDPNEQGVPNVLVTLYDLGFDGIYGTSDDEPIAGTYTDFTGHYLFTDVPAGKYVIEFHPFTIPNGNVFTSDNQGGNDALDSDVDTSGITHMFMVMEGQMDDLNFDAGIYQKCSNVTNGGNVQGDETVCGPGDDPNLITSISLPTGGFGDIEYLWMMSSNTAVFNGPTDPNWQIIPGATGPEYDPGPIFTTSYFARCSRRACCSNYFEANIVRKLVSDVPQANIESGPSTVCTQETVSYTAAFSGNTSSYNWNFGANAIPASYVGRIVPEVRWTSSGNKTITLTTNINGCENSNTTTVSVSNCIIPLGQFEGLTGQLMEESYVKLNWATIAEPFQSRFIIERADIEQDKFHTLDLMEGHGGSESHTYELKDLKPLLGHNYYRIKHMDNNGEYVFSELVSVFWQPTVVKDIHVFPNPFQEQTTLQLLQPLEEDGTIQLVSAYGQVLDVLPLAADTYQMTLDFSTYPKGMYVIYVCYNGYRKLAYRLFKTDDF